MQKLTYNIDLHSLKNQSSIQPGQEIDYLKHQLYTTFDILDLTVFHLIFCSKFEQQHTLQLYEIPILNMKYSRGASLILNMIYFLHLTRSKYLLIDLNEPNKQIGNEGGKQIERYKQSFPQNSLLFLVSHIMQSYQINCFQQLMTQRYYLVAL